MRTKALLMAAALLAASLASTQAQVYSVNVVGYVNLVLKGSNALNLIGNPLDNGTNTANGLLGALPNKATLQTWSGTSYSTSTKAGGTWSGNPLLAPGTGFFVRLSTVATTANLTNTFVGNVIPNSVVLTTNRSIPTNLVLVSSMLPVGGNLNDVGTNKLNINATIPNKSTIQTWVNTGAGAFSTSTKAGGTWGVNQAISVGQGFFLNSKAATNWSQTVAY